MYNPANILLASSSINNILFTGRIFEYQAKVYNYRNREKDPSLGRFSQRDPLEFLDGFNSYAYVHNNPVNRTDPLGLVDKWGAATSAALIVLNGTAAVASAVATVASSTTVVGAVVGGAAVAYFSYNVGVNAGNLDDAWNDRPLSSTGDLFPDLADVFAPCNKTIRYGAVGASIVAGVFGGGPIKAGINGAKAVGNITKEAIEVATQAAVKSGIKAAEAVESNLGNVIREVGEVVAKTETSFFEGTRYTNKVLAQMKSDLFHAFPESIKELESSGVISTIKGGDGITRQILKIPGEFKGKKGFFEFIKEADGSINHRFFRPNP